MTSIKGLSGYAFVTGTASGIGQESAWQLAEAGAAGIVFADLNKAGAKEAAEKSKSLATNPSYKAIALKIDITKKASVQEAVAFTLKEFGRIDYGVHCAGIGTVSNNPISDPVENEYTNIWEVNTKGTVFVTGALVAAMEKNEIATVTGRNGVREIGRGSIVNLASADSHIAEPFKGPYIASKHAALGITKVAAVENAKKQIRVNALCPTWVDTPMMEGYFTVTQGLREIIKKKHPKGRMALPEEVASAVLYLLSPGASYITGTGLVIDHGILLSVNV
ncbi:hypothetical protein AJ79_05574 [Helicocarpus griseus UAMH5409]|uniref:Uncharacterized protein n=1 Tax=Helicocarpus griseus UAMH5409 TaxID=1447875 RepID=A0A2B7XMM5_9EURO|nr:hypothetical protein AJ79_05574 [Helicocarpus griseus UAMH5409]